MPKIRINTGFRHFNPLFKLLFVKVCLFAHKYIYHNCQFVCELFLYELMEILKGIIILGDLIEMINDIIITIWQDNINAGIFI